MISLIEARNYRCLRYVRQELGPFHVLVGPNASGKTTFLDVISFLNRFVAEGLEAAVSERTSNFSDLVWDHSQSGFELAVEARIPENLRERLNVPSYDTVRYAIEIGTETENGPVLIKAEKGWLKVADEEFDPQRRFDFPEPQESANSIVAPFSRSHKRSLFTKSLHGNDNFYAETHPKEGRWAPAFKLGPYKSTLGNLPEDEENFPVSTMLKRLLSDGVEQFVLHSLHIRRASPPNQGAGFRPDGSNLPWVVEQLEQSDPLRITNWIQHLRTALPDLAGIRTVLREDDKHRYLMLKYDSGLEVPSWMVSDGTLRLLALTLPAYLPNLRGIYLIEEPENGIHPRAVETMFESLSSVYDAQILLATHSPVIISVARPEDVLCFAKTPEGATDIVAGDKHPKLRDWRGQVDLGTLFAAGVLG